MISNNDKSKFKRDKGMAEEKNDMAKGLLIGFLAGGIVGTIIGLLYAPKSGKELRSDIKRKATNLAEDAGEFIRVARTKGAGYVQQAKRRSEQLVSETKEKAEHILGDAERMLSDIKERAGSEGSRIKSAFRAGVEAYKTEKNKGLTE